MNDDTEVRVLNSALDESEIRGGSIIMRGVIHPETLQFLKVDQYQRERKPVSSLSSIWQAIKHGEPLPDIELGMRGERYFQAKDGTIYLQDAVYIIDGLQRQTAALNFMEEVGKLVRIGCVIHFGTDRAWERERFRVLNSTQGRVSSNILLRNLRETNPGVLTIYGLSTNDPNFALFKRVCWSQSMGRHDLIGSVSLAKVALELHRHLGENSSIGVRALDLGAKLGLLGNRIGLNILRENTREFFAAINDSWPIAQVDTQSPTPFLRGGFLTALCRVFSSHTDFWRNDDMELFIDADMRRKIGRFHIFDPHVANMCSQNNSGSITLLARHVIDHINSGKRANRLTLRKVLQIGPQQPEQEGDEAA